MIIISTTQMLFLPYRLSDLDQSMLLDSDMKKYFQFTKAYLMSQHVTHKNEYLNSIKTCQSQYIGCKIANTYQLH